MDSQMDIVNLFYDYVDAEDPPESKKVKRQGRGRRVLNRKLIEFDWTTPVTEPPTEKLKGPETDEPMSITTSLGEDSTDSTIVDNISEATEDTRSSIRGPSCNVAPTGEDSIDSTIVDSISAATEDTRDDASIQSRYGSEKGKLLLLETPKPRQVTRVRKRRINFKEPDPPQRRMISKEVPQHTPRRSPPSFFQKILCAKCWK